MKKNLFFAVAALAALTFTSCSKEDNPGSPVYTTISFEDKTLGEYGIWYGDENGTKFDNWGSEAYSCTYEEKGVTFPVNYTPSWASWSGYGISNRTETTYTPSLGGVNPAQFNSIVGKAYNGENFCVIYPFGEPISITDGAVVKGFYYTNEAWVVDAILNGDGMTPGKFEADDWLKCTVTGETIDGTTSSVDIMLAENGDYVKDWKFVDLSSLGKVVKLTFTFDGTKKNDWGLTTPTYMCIDQIILEK